jgi:hypothetical protein
MKMKRILIVALALILVVALAACGGGGDGGSGSSGGGNTPASPANSGGEDPCPCCPDCSQKKDCVCKVCGDNDDYDCKCSAPGGEHPSITYGIEIETALGDDECNYDDCGMDTLGKATVTMNYIDSKTGYLGSAEGSGVTTKNGTHEMAVKYTVAYGDLPDYTFTVQLSMPSNDKTYVGVDENYQTILVGVNKLGPDVATIDWTDWGGGPVTGPSFLSFIQQGLLEDAAPSDVGTAYPDMNTGLLTFEMPLMDTPIRVLFAWGEILDIYITLTPVD